MNLLEFKILQGSGLEDKFISLLDELPTMILITNSEGRIVYSNGQVETELGFTLQDLKDIPIWYLYKDHEKGEQLFDKWNKQAGEGEVNSFNINLHLPNKTKKWLDVKVRKLKTDQFEDLALWTACDISRLKIMEKDLARNKARVEAILESATEGIFTTNKKGIILSVNPAVKQIFGYRESEMIGEELCSFISLPTTDFAAADFTGRREMLMGRNWQGQAKDKDGQVFPVELSLNEIVVGKDVFYTGLLRDRSESRKLEAEILKIVESERFTLGQELHDGVGQMFSAIAMISRNLARKAKANNMPIANELEEITAMIQEADQEIRQLSHGLAHVELENEGLQVALKRMCERFQLLSEKPCRFICSPGLEITDYNTRLHLFRIVQEAVQNAIKHGDPNQIQVKLQNEVDYLVLTVEDDGKGLMSDFDEEKQKGMGLNTMRYRAEILGGNFSIENASDGWTKVNCMIPLQKGSNS
ncbi:MAG: PAS domain S-box protein [Gracilimonas sp.]|uniref:PAS domain-containing sensor histidine kinase n=1 Tax=Gracilimonas sp. TaxID=1974203 RepID=UPI0019989754|nr:PAS domain S-box protein [Gracilimonas sp.]MBD3616317.1 PAS domain S-box protein [Gracilimonas sp.]